ncbi:MAG: recombinase family protein, partial [Blautia sp.]
IRDAYESGIDSLEEYKANKERLISNRLQLETGLEKLRKEQEEKEVNKEDVLHEIKSLNDILKNPDVSYEEKGTLIRTIVDQIVYDKESGKMYFDIIVS